MQRTIFNVWGREYRHDPGLANTRLERALAANPKITNQHIQIRVQEPSVFDARHIVFYRPAWYDRKVATKNAAYMRKAKAREAANPPPPLHECNCRYCDYYD